MRTQHFFLGCFLLLILGFFSTTHTAHAVKGSVVVQQLEVSGWIPYWRKATGTAEAILHMRDFTEINPFGYTVKTDGTLFDAMEVDKAPWPALVLSARLHKTRVIPTVMWSNADAMHNVLSSPTLRAKHIKEITNMVYSHNFDGVDIDYEAKYAKTKDYFSLFLKELYAAMGKKWVMCTIEARTPLSSRYDTIPPDIEYANDYVQINKYCDRVRIMAYDQGAIDLRLNQSTVGPYVPVSDPKWVEKVIELTAQTIPKKKLVLGIPTYGYEYRVTPLSEGYRYNRQWAFNQKYALGIAEMFKLKPARNAAGELSFMYVPTTTPLATTSTAPIVKSGAPATITKPVHILWWSDGIAIRDKILLANRLGLRGVALFKIDGGVDPLLWPFLQ